MADHLSKWQKDVETLWKKASIRPTFEADLMRLRQNKRSVKSIFSGEVRAVAEAQAFLIEYGIPDSALSMVLDYIETGNLSFRLVENPIDVFPAEAQGILSSINNSKLENEAQTFFQSVGYVYLKINPVIHNKKQLLEWVDKNWKEEIEPKLKAMGHLHKRLRLDAVPDVNQEILGMYSRGYGPARIAEELKIKQEQGLISPEPTFTAQSVSKKIQRFKKDT